MGERNKRTDAVIVSVREQGENNRSVCVFSPDEGIFYATLYGGAKSRYRALVQQFHSGIIYFYDDEVKKNRKLTDFDVKKQHTSLRTSLYKFWAANLAAELLIKTKCAGDNKSSFVLFNALIDGMDAVDEKEARLGMLRFLWRYLGLLGVQPDAGHCASCGGIPGRTNIYSPGINGFLCPDCSLPLSKEDSPILLTKEALDYLEAINNETPAFVRRIELDTQSEYSLKSSLARFSLL